MEINLTCDHSLVLVVMNSLAQVTTGHMCFIFEQVTLDYANLSIYTESKDVEK